jgi:hypothetical protein
MSRRRCALIRRPNAVATPPISADSHASSRSVKANRCFFTCCDRGKRQIDFADRTGERPPTAKGIDSLNVVLPLTTTSHELYRGHATLLIDIETSQTFVPKSARIDPPGRPRLIAKDSYIFDGQDPARRNFIGAGAGLRALRWRTLGRIRCGVGRAEQWPGCKKARD